METAAPAASAPAAAPSSAPAPSSTPSATPAPSPASPGAPASTPAPSTAAPTTPTPAPAKRYTAKVNGQVREIEAAHVEALANAFGVTPDEILKGTGMAQSSYQRWQEAARLRKEAEEREKAWKARYEDPRVTQIKANDPSLSDDEAWALAKTQELYERSQMNPDQRALADERARREKLEREVKEREEGTKKAQLEAETRAEAAKIDRGLTESLAKHQMPRVPAVARAVLDHMATMARAGEVVDVEAATLFVKRQIQADDQSRLAAFNDEQLEGWLGKAIVDRILKRSIEKVRGTPTPTPPTPPTPRPVEPEGRRYLNEDEWRKKYGFGG